jgi:hypothetical protein
MAKQRAGLMIDDVPSSTWARLMIKNHDHSEPDSGWDQQAWKKGADAARRPVWFSDFSASSSL